MAEMTRPISSSIAFEESEQLVVRLKAGDEAAFDEVFYLYKDMVYTLSCKFLADKGEALDITQEVFLTLHRKINGFRGDCSLKTWLYRVTVNQAANRNRWWKRRFRSRTLSLDLDPDDGLSPTPEPSSDNPWPDRHVYAKELRQAIEQGLKKLPFDQRVAVTLREVEGLTYEEIAEVTDANVGTVKSRIARGRERLRKDLEACQNGANL